MYNPDYNHAYQLIVSPDASRKGKLLTGAVPEYKTELQNHLVGNPIYWGDPDQRRIVLPNDDAAFPVGKVPRLNSSKYHFADVMAYASSGVVGDVIPVRHIRNPAAAGTIADPAEYFDPTPVNGQGFDYWRAHDFTFELAFHHHRATDRMIAYDSGGQRFYISGSNWARVTQFSPSTIDSSFPRLTAGLVTRQGTICIAAGGTHNNPRNLIYRSTDRGLTWTLVYNQPTPAFAFSAFNGRRTFTAGGAASETADVAAFSMIYYYSQTYGSQTREFLRTAFLRSTDDGLTWGWTSPMEGQTVHEGWNGYIHFGEYSRSTIGGNERYHARSYVASAAELANLNPGGTSNNWVYTEDYGLTVVKVVQTAFHLNRAGYVRYGNGQYVARWAGFWYIGNSLASMSLTRNTTLTTANQELVDAPVYSNGYWWAHQLSYPYNSNPVGANEVYRGLTLSTMSLYATIPGLGAVHYLVPTDSPLHHVAGKSHREMVQWGLSAPGVPLYG